MSSNYVAEFNSSSSSELNSSSCTADQSLNGLKFGKKIYFEDVGFAAPAKSGGGLSVSLSTPSKKVKVVAVQGAAQPPRCQVQGCEVDLSDAKAYYSRHKVCSMHSKSPSVVVAGLEQRFCQQCSRFHQLPEFDQGKRSCRRRLAGHNERRRKPPPASLFNSNYGRLSSSVFESHGRVGGLLMDFTAYPKLTTRDSWPSSKYPEQVFGSQTSSVTGKRLPRCLQGNSESLPYDIFMQGSIGGTSVPIEKIHPGECFTSATDSSCALSLLSNQPWGSSQAFHVGSNNLVNFEGTATTQTIAPPSHSAPIHNIPSAFWCFKGNEAGGSSHETVTDIGLSQITKPFAIQRSGEPELSDQSARQYVEIENWRSYLTSQQMHWSL